MLQLSAMSMKIFLGLSSPKVLQHTVFYYVGLNFVLWGVQEQHDLVPAHFVRVPSDFTVHDSLVYYDYTEFISKNIQHCLPVRDLPTLCTFVELQ